MWTEVCSGVQIHLRSSRLGLDSGSPSHLHGRGSSASSLGSRSPPGATLCLSGSVVYLDTHVSGLFLSCHLKSQRGYDLVEETKGKSWLLWINNGSDYWMKITVLNKMLKKLLNAIVLLESLMEFLIVSVCFILSHSLEWVVTGPPVGWNELNNVVKLFWLYRWSSS